MIAINRRAMISTVAGAVATAAFGGSARAQSGEASAGDAAPAGSKPPLRVLIGFSRHSASDDLVQLIEPDLSAALERPLRIDLMPGDLGAKAAKEALTSPRDGNMLLVATFGTHAINPNLKQDLGYDPVADFMPVTLATRSPLVLGTRLSLGAKSTEELVALAKRQVLTYGSSGVGSAPYLAALLFQRTTGVKMIHRPYTDTRVLYDDLLGERLDLSFNNAASMMPLVRAGRLRGLAVTTAERSKALPDIPTVAEAGLEGYALNNWLGFVVPSGTNATIADGQSRAIAGVLRKAPITKALADNGIEVVGSTPAEFADYMQAELKRWSWVRSM